jgi:hypothetical protein
MNEISFQCSKIELLDKVKHLRSFVKPKSPKARREAAIEIRVQPNYVSLCIPGIEVKQFCSTEGWGSFTLSLEYFYLILTDYTGAIFAPKFIDGEMQAGGLFTKGLGYKIQNTHPENKPTVEIPLNYKPADILNLRDKLDPKSIGIASAYALIERAEAKLKEDVRDAHKALSKYGVSRNEIEELVKKSIEK